MALKTEHSITSGSVSSDTIPADASEAEGKFSWGSTSMVFAQLQCGGGCALGSTRADEGTGKAAEKLLKVILDTDPARHGNTAIDAAPHSQPGRDGRRPNGDFDDCRHRARDQGQNDHAHLRGPHTALWEFRGERQQYTDSKVMAWVAFDRGVRMIEKYGIRGHMHCGRKIRDEIHARVCRDGNQCGRGTFTQASGIPQLVASLLLLSLIGFLADTDPHIAGSVKAFERQLLRDGLLLRSTMGKIKDGLPPGERAFLACNFRLVDVDRLQGRRAEARAPSEKLVDLRNDLGLLSEEYDSSDGLIGSYPRASSHIALINAALALEFGTRTRLHALD